MGFVYGAHIDYLTTTWALSLAASPLPSVANIIDWARRKANEKGARESVKAWAWQGYTGWSVGSFCFGERQDGTIVRVSSALAHDYVTSGLPIGHNVSRLDVCLDVWGVKDIDNQIALHKEETLMYRNNLHSRPYEVRLQETFGGGDTLYLGARSSGLFVRIYNKEKEQATNEYYHEAIRYEVEIKDDRGRKIVDKYRDGGYRSFLLTESILGFLERRGVHPVGLPVGGGVYVDSSPRAVGDIDASLAWLRSQVAPTVRRLLKLGYRPDIIDALGLELRKDERDVE